MNSTQEQRLREAEAQLDYELTERKIRTIESLLYKATADAVLRESSPSEYVTPELISRETGWGNGRALRVSTIDDYKDGQFRPVYENERDLQEIRGCGRVLATSDEMAIAVCKNLAGYVVGEGGEYAVKPKLKGQELELVAEVQRFVDEFVEANDLEDCGETDVLLTSVIDGDCLEALIARGSYAPEVELIGAETIMEPQNFREVEDYIGEVGLNWRFGVASLPGRPQKVMGYFAARQDGDWDFFPADEAVFTKRNAPKQCKRGVSDFYAPYKRITRGAKLFDYSVMGATIQASIAYIKEHATGTPEASLSSALDSRLRRDVTAAKGDGSVVSVTGMDTLPGRILNVAGTKYHAGPMGSPQGPLYMDVYQAVARRVGSRWQMPEYMISGDASNANYASTLAAESPFVKAMKGEQGGLAKSRKELIWKAIAIAAKHGRFGGMTAADLYQRVVVEVTYPSVEVRDPLAQEQVFDSQQAAGVLSVKTRAAKSGLDYEDELANGAKEKQENPLAGLMGPQQGFGGQPFGGQVRESVAGRDGDGDGLINDGKPDEGPAPAKAKEKKITVDDLDSVPAGKLVVYYGRTVGFNEWKSRGNGQYRSERDEPRDADHIRRYIKDFGHKDGNLVVMDAEPVESKAAPATKQETPLMNPAHAGYGKKMDAAASAVSKAGDWSSVSSSEKLLKQRANDMFRTTELTKDQWTSVAADVYFNNNNVSKAFKGHKKYADAVAKHFLPESVNESFDPYALAAKLLWEGYEAPHILEGTSPKDGDGDGLINDGKSNEGPAPMTDDYHGNHRPPGPDNGAPLHDLTGGGTIYPDDIYSKDAARFYGQGDDALDRETVKILHSLRGKPDAIVKAYRAVPSGAPNSIKAGDWVTVNKNYAKYHGEGPLGGDYKIVSVDARADELFTNGDSFHEQGYHPKAK